MKTFFVILFPRITDRNLIFLIEFSPTLVFILPTSNICKLIHMNSVQGILAQLAERLDQFQKVVGSTPASSAIGQLRHDISDGLFPRNRVVMLPLYFSFLTKSLYFKKLSKYESHCRFLRVGKVIIFVQLRSGRQRIMISHILKHLPIKKIFNFFQILNKF